LRRYSLTLILIVALLVVGGLAIARFLGEPPLARGGYVPTLSEDPAMAQWQALIFVLGLGATLFLMVGLGVALAVTFVRLTGMLKRYESVAAADAPARSTGPRPQTARQELDIPLSSDRSAAIFWIVVVLIVVGFQVVRLWGEPLGYLPGPRALTSIPLFRLPGERIEALPPFIAGPGDDVTAMHIMILVLGIVVVATIVTGIAMARGVNILTLFMQTADQRPPTLPDRLIPMFEQRLARLRQPRPATRRIAGNPFDKLLVGINIVLLLAIAAVIAFYVVPSYSGVAAVDTALEATRVAALATATPESAGPPESGGVTRIEALQAQLDALPAGNPADGRGTFASAGCSACHSLDAGVTLVGPSLNGLGAAAATRRPEYSAALYLYESIVHPDAYIVQGFQGGIMPQTFERILTPQQLADLVAFLETQ
jgi:cytochrome c2